MVKNFFISIWSFAFVLILLINLMCAFAFAEFDNTHYFGITTLIEMLNPSNYNGSGMAKYIVDYFAEIRSFVPQFSNALTSLRTWLNSADASVKDIPFAVAQGIFVIVKLLTYIVEILGIVVIYGIALMMYVAYLLEAFLDLITGKYLSATPVPSWIYPSVHFVVANGFIPSTITI